MNKIIHAESGHTLFVQSISINELPNSIDKEDTEKYSDFYVVKNWDVMLVLSLCIQPKDMSMLLKKLLFGIQKEINGIHLAHPFKRQLMERKKTVGDVCLMKSFINIGDTK